jgi:transmembrane sensor
VTGLENASSGACEAATDLAASWFARRRAGPNARDERAFAEWLEADPANRTAYAEVANAWALAGTAASDPEIIAMRGEALMLRPADRRGARVWFAGIAAAVLLAIGVGYWTHVDGPETVKVAALERGVLQTAVGERSTVTLADGSVVTLNTSSKVRIAFTPGRRNVSLIAGQALFQVAKDSTRPFVVSAGDRQVVAIGTEFEVRLEKAGVRVTLLEGRVQVRPRADVEAAAVARGEAAGPVATLEPGEQLLATPFGRLAVKAAAVSDVVSWREGRVRFDDMALTDAVAEMNRYSVTPIVIGDPAVAGIRVSGAFRTGQTDAFIASITEIFPVTARHEVDRIVLLQKR